MMNIHCQPCSPAKPSMVSSRPPSGAPTMLAIETPSRNMPLALARSLTTNHWVRKYITPGKRPASAMPSSIRMM